MNPDPDLPAPEAPVQRLFGLTGLALGICDMTWLRSSGKKLFSKESEDIHCSNEGFA